MTSTCERGLVRFRPAKGGKTLEVALHSSARSALTDYLERGRQALVDTFRIEIR
jgi:site-specific recombinase XerD